MSSDGVWTVIDAQSGRVTDQIAGGAGPHNTIVGLSGSRVYLGGPGRPASPMWTHHQNAGQ